MPPPSSSTCGHRSLRSARRPPLRFVAPTHRMNEARGMDPALPPRPATEARYLARTGASAEAAEEGLGFWDAEEAGGEEVDGGADGDGDQGADEVGAGNSDQVRWEPAAERP